MGRAERNNPNARRNVPAETLRQYDLLREEKFQIAVRKSEKKARLRLKLLGMRTLARAREAG